jgi:hypothetical protein
VRNKTGESLYRFTRINTNSNPLQKTIFDSSHNQGMGARTLA